MATKKFKPNAPTRSACESLPCKGGNVVCFDATKDGERGLFLIVTDHEYPELWIVGRTTLIARQVDDGHTLDMPIIRAFFDADGRTILCVDNREEPNLLWRMTLRDDRVDSHELVEPKDYTAHIESKLMTIEELSHVDHATSKSSGKRLIAAVYRGDIKATADALKAGADPDTLDEDGNPIHHDLHAYGQRRAAAAELFQAYGADVDLRPWQLASAASAIMEKDAEGLIQLCEKYDISGGEKHNGQTLLDYAARPFSPKEGTDLVKLLIARGGYLALDDPSAVLIRLNAAKNCEILSMLLERGLDPDARAGHVPSLLDHAIASAYSEPDWDCAKLLIESGATVERRHLDAARSANAPAELLDMMSNRLVQ